MENFVERKSWGRMENFEELWRILWKDDGDSQYSGHG
jgi:hypothetical protein